jgi:hypothetical protein
VNSPVYLRPTLAHLAKWHWLEYVAGEKSEEFLAAKHHQDHLRLGELPAHDEEDCGEEGDRSVEVLDRPENQDAPFRSQSEYVAYIRHLMGGTEDRPKQMA